MTSTQQLALEFDKPNNHREFDFKVFESELQELAGENVKVKLKLDKHQELTTSICHTDHLSEAGEYLHDVIFITFNPRKLLRGPKKLEEHLSYCREEVTK